MNTVDSLLQEVINLGSHISADKLIFCYGKRLVEPIFVNIDTAIHSTNREMRLSGIVRLLLNTCYGADTEMGAPLASATLNLLVRDWASFNFKQTEHLHTLCGATLMACIYAHYEEGQWSICSNYLNLAATEFPFVKKLTQYWEASGLVARMMIGSNLITEAKNILELIPASESSKDLHVNLAKKDLLSFESKRFELNERILTEDQARIIWEQAFTDNLTTLRALSNNVRESKEQVIPFGIAELEPLQYQLVNMRSLARSVLPFEQKYAQLAADNQRWRETLFSLLNPKYDTNRVTKEWVSRVLDRASYYHATPKADKKAAEACLRDLTVACCWSRNCNDWHRVWLTDWSRILILERMGLNKQCIEVIKSLTASINERHIVADQPQIRSNIANYLPGIAGKMCKMHDKVDDPLTLFDTCELRKARSLLASSTCMELNLTKPIEPEALGARTHYISYTVLYHEDRIQACLYTSNGKIISQRIKISVKTIIKFAKRLDPADWDKLWFGDQRTPQQALAPLMHPLEAALESGHINSGDHICVAADDPINLIPLQYLMVAGNVAVMYVSISRVLSFSDAKMLACSKESKPLKAMSIFVSSTSKNDTQRHKDFDNIVQRLTQILPRSNYIAEKIMTADKIMDAMQTHSVIHLYTHGMFSEGENPYIHSGLVVSDGNGPPILDGDQNCLLTPKLLLDRKLKLCGSHITLSACVSGLGLEGKGGDALGLEMALRLCGVSSILATHWKVKWSDASMFSEEFYRNWLVNGLSRGEAWRQTILTLMNQEDSSSRAEEWCAFSLFGDWQ